MSGLKSPTSERIAERLVISGRVQGVGLRPALARWAAECGVSGSICNTTSGVEIVAEGEAEQVRQFVDGMTNRLPAAAFVGGMQRVKTAVRGRRVFAIEMCSTAGPLSVEAPLDVAVCADCLSEVADSGDRRANYPFTSCTSCGPRYSILESLPYEREATSMASFRLCRHCQAEYDSPSDRRFHSQTNACPACGPQVWCVDRTGRVLAERDGAIKAAVSAIIAGEIVALRGVGGYQLLCDATSSAAVIRLRQRKGRPQKPLAVMVESISAANRVAAVDNAARRALESPANPIVVVPALPDNRLATDIHPGLNDVGLFLPTTPLHWLLLHKARRPLVATSGNREGEPLSYEIEQSQARLSGIADVWLHHDRPIHHPIDDSVVRIIGNRPVTLRLARGLAPLRLPLDAAAPLLALGGQQKTALAISNGVQAVLGPHLGDLDDVATFDRLLGHASQLRALYGAEPSTLVHDLHPEYATTRWAVEQPLKALAVQHHHAHIVSGMLDAGWLDRQVLGVAWDGTGCGADGTIWGGEFLLATATTCQRVAHLRPFSLPGGEAAIRQPWRVAAALVRNAIGDEAAKRLEIPGVMPHEISQVLEIAGRRRFSPTTTSAGRLFDAVAALTLGIVESAYEGFPAMLLEATCDELDDAEYEMPLRSQELDWRPMIAQIVHDKAKGISAGCIAQRFHRGLAAGILSVCRQFRAEPVVLAGGVFQNRVLSEVLMEAFHKDGRMVDYPGTIPPGDGGLAAGQLAIAASLLASAKQQEIRPCA